MISNPITKNNKNSNSNNNINDNNKNNNNCNNNIINTINKAAPAKANAYYVGFCILRSWHWREPLGFLWRPKTIHPMRAYTYIALDLTFGVLACCGEVSFSYVAQKTNMPNGCLP